MAAALETLDANLKEVAPGELEGIKTKAVDALAGVLQGVTEQGDEAATRELEVAEPDGQELADAKEHARSALDALFDGMSEDGESAEGAEGEPSDAEVAKAKSDAREA